VLLFSISSVHHKDSSTSSSWQIRAHVQVQESPFAWTVVDDKRFTVPCAPSVMVFTLRGKQRRL